MDTNLPADHAPDPAAELVQGSATNPDTKKRRSSSDASVAAATVKKHRSTEDQEPPPDQLEAVPSAPESQTGTVPSHATHSQFTAEELELWQYHPALRQQKGLSDDAYNKHIALSVIVTVVNLKKPGAFNENYQDADSLALRELVNRNPSLSTMLEQRDFKGVMASALLLAPPTKEETGEVKFWDVVAAAYQASWRTPFRGSADALYNTIRNHMREGSGTWYARYAFFTQASGTGKSRMNDELAKKILYIPVNLAPVGTEVYPPPDTPVYMCLDFDTTDQTRYAKRIQAFLYAVFFITRECLETIAKERNIPIRPDTMTDDQSRVGLFAKLFREKMTEGMQFGRHGDYRVAFYESVCKKASEFYKKCVLESGRVNWSPKISITTQGPDGTKRKETAQDAARALIKFLTSSTGDTKPYVILCFDDCRGLLEHIAGQEWTRYSKLQRGLGVIAGLPIFTLFLSTMGPLEPPAPDPEMTSSSVLVEKSLRVLPPIVATPLDLLACRFPPKGSTPWTLAKVASTSHIAHLGRPLFGAMADTGKWPFQEHHMMDFAVSKLLNSNKMYWRLSDIQELACFGVRLPLDFKQSVFDNKAEWLLVSDHLRLLLFVDVGFTRQITACASEPLLAEASYRVWSCYRWSRGKPRLPTRSGYCSETPRNPISVLERHLPHLDLGTRGEIVVAMLLLDARDCATTTVKDIESKNAALEDTDSTYAALERIVTVLQFLEALIGTSPESCLASLPASFREEHRSTSLKDAFKDYYVYFNHFIKVQSVDIVNQEYLLLAISRGAALICADNQDALDIIIPILRGKELVKDKVSAIMIQVKNSRQYTTNVQTSLFVGMNPYGCGVFDKHVENPPPVVRMVFALASSASIVTTRQHGTGPTSKASRFTAYDLWFAGASQETFGVVQNEEEEAQLAKLLKTLRGKCDAIDSHKSIMLQEVARQMQPLTMMNKTHFTNWVELEEDTKIGCEVDLEDVNEESEV